MNNPVKAALIVAVAIVLAVILYIFFSPYQTCVRNYKGTLVAELVCAKLLGTN